MKNLIRFLSKLIVKKYQPEIIAISGSVGKSSVKEAIFSVLKTKFNIRKNLSDQRAGKFSFNYTVIGAENGESNFLKNLGVLFKALGLVFKKDKNYPKILIFEVPAEEIKNFNDIYSVASHRTGIITNIDPEHLENFVSLENLIKEKSLIISGLGEKDSAILNSDDKEVFGLAQKTKAEVITFGFSDKAAVKASEVTISRSSSRAEEEVLKIAGLSFKLSYKGSSVPVHLPNVLGKQHIYAALAAACVGIKNDLNLLDISQGLSNYQAPGGRMKLVDGIKYTLLIDDTYNATPLSTQAALEIFAEFVLDTNKQKFAVLGDIMDLGTESENIHFNLGKRIAALKINYLVTVGERSRDIIRGAKANGMAGGLCFNFSNIEEAGKFVQEKMKKGDLILINGSKEMRMENITKELMGDPLLAEELLVRQDLD